MNKYLLPFATLFLLIGCDSKVVQTGTHEFAKQSWAIDDVREFKIEMNDTVGNYDLFLHLRNNQDYGYNNLWLISEMRFPLGQVITDTLLYEMAYPNGEFMGTYRGSVVENKLWLKQNVRFPENGTYLLKLRHAMRKNGEEDGLQDLRGVLDLGYTVEIPEQ